MQKLNFELIKTLTLNQMKIKYKRSFLGFFWSLLNPILMVTLISLVFSTIIGMDYFEFVLFFFPAFLIWVLFSITLTTTTMSLIRNESLIKKVNINKFIFIYSSFSIVVVEFFLAFTVFISVGLLIGLELSIAILTIPISFILISLFAIGFGMILSILVLFFRDIEHFLSLFLQLLFYLSPILYPTARLNEFELLAKLNPMVIYIELFRMPIFNSTFPPIEYFSKAFLISTITFIVGYLFFKQNEHKIIFKL